MKKAAVTLMTSHRQKQSAHNVPHVHSIIQSNEKIKRTLELNVLAFDFIPF